MLNQGDIFDVLQKCSAYANEKTPSPSEATILAWVEHFNQFPHIRRDDALTAVARYYRDPRDRLVQPADISRVARDLVQDRALRGPESVAITATGQPATVQHRGGCMSEIRAALDGKRFGSAP